MRILQSIPPAQVEAKASDAAAYVRRARKLRAEFAGRTQRLHHELQQMPARAAMRLVEAPSAGEMFADEVAQSLEGGLLRYSSRMALIRRADQLGIERFEANLIIAAVLYRTPNLQIKVAARRRSRMATAILAVLGAEAVSLLILFRYISG